MDTDSKYSLRSLSRTDYLGLYRSRVFAAVSTIADDASALDYQLLSQKLEAVDHEYMKFITRDFIRYTVAYLKLCGSVYIRKIKSGNKILGLQMLRPDLVSAERNQTRTKILRYLYNYGGNVVAFLPEELICMHNFNPAEPYGLQSRGYGDVQAAAISVDMENASEVWNWKFFENANYPGAVLSTEQTVDGDERERIQTDRENKYKGANNAHKLAVLTNGLKLEKPQPGQKEADFVEQQRFAFEKILAIFKVPKAKLGMGEGVNVGNVKAFDIIFARGVIRPLALKISEVLTRELFAGVGTFEFINIVPVDEASLRDDYRNNLITRNEYRVLTGMNRVQGGDKFYDGSDGVVEVKPTKEAPQKRSVTINTIKLRESAIDTAIRKSIYGTEEWAESRWTLKVARAEEQEKTYKSALVRIRALQKLDILKQMEEKKSIKSNIPTLDPTKWITVWLSIIKPIQQSIFQLEGDIAMQEVAPDKTFDPNDEKVQKAGIENIKRLGSSVDLVTGEYIRNTINQALEMGMTPAQIRNKIEDYFDGLSRIRADMIVRSETIRAGTIAQQQAREQSGLVESKIWYTARDERVCEFCGPMHGKKVSLQDSFQSKGDTITGENGSAMKLDYRDTVGSPLHPNCRCDMIAVLK